MVMLLIVWLPDVALVPVQPPDAVHDVVLVLDQVSVELPPDDTEVGFAVSVSVGAGGGPDCTVTVAERWIDPPAPLHDSV
ncbi:MAG TPA: hypothetical protein VLD59_13160 [Steroidobacteraceae bacterium]|nr:hypothetical protein [Steroidobacteraceae bacterium]